ncbi:MAG: glycerate kinase type-2 family protein [Geminicoccaceae bacterium]
MKQEPARLLRAMFDAAVDAASPAACVPPHLPPSPKGRTIVVGAGKAAATMAKAVEDNWDGPLEGLVVTRYGHAVPCERIEVVEASHPVPDAAGETAARRILEMLGGLAEDDLVLALISGGGSSLLCLPAEVLTLEDKQAVNRVLLKSGASIDQMNCVRKHLSAIKGGRLAAEAHPAKVVSLLISDVPGDDPSVIASGPTVPDPSTFADALAALETYGIDQPKAVIAYLRRGDEDTPKPGAPCFDSNELELIATPQRSLDAAKAVAKEAGVNALILGDAVEGEARQVAKVMAGIAKGAALHGQPIEPPGILISGGETTVTVRGSGWGGRNVEFLLALALQLEDTPGIYAIAGDTDGVDGAEEIAGAQITPDSLTRAKNLGISAKVMLADNDGHIFFQALGDQVITGPTLTNVNDFRAIMITERQE